MQAKTRSSTRGWFAAGSDCRDGGCVGLNQRVGGLGCYEWGIMQTDTQQGKCVDGERRREVRDGQAADGRKEASRDGRLKRADETRRLWLIAVPRSSSPRPPNGNPLKHVLASTVKVKCVRSKVLYMSVHSYRYNTEYACSILTAKYAPFAFDHVSHCTRTTSSRQALDDFAVPSRQQSFAQENTMHVPHCIP